MSTNPRRQVTGELRRLLRLRLKMERREPRWMRIDEWRYKRVEGKGWRRPRSLDNKIRKEVKGYPRRVKVGYGKPRLVRGLHPSGFEEVIVHRPEDLKGVDPSRQAVRIASTVGLRKRIEIVKKAQELGIRVLNITADVKRALESRGTSTEEAQEGAQLQQQ